MDVAIYSMIAAIFDAAREFGLSTEEVDETVTWALRGEPRHSDDGVPLWGERIVEALARQIEEKNC